MTYQPDNKDDWWKTEHYECECREHSHTIRFFKQQWDDFDIEFGVEVFLNHYLPWYERLWIGLKYIFGYQGKGYSHFDSWILRKQDRQRLVDMLAETPEVHEVLQSVRTSLKRSPHPSTKKIVEKINKVLPMDQREYNIAMTMARGTPCAPSPVHHECLECGTGPCTGNVDLPINK